MSSIIIDIKHNGFEREKNIRNVESRRKRKVENVKFNLEK